MFVHAVTTHEQTLSLLFSRLGSEWVRRTSTTITKKMSSGLVPKGDNPMKDSHVDARALTISEAVDLGVSSPTSYSATPARGPAYW